VVRNVDYNQKTLVYYSSKIAAHRCDTSLIVCGFQVKDRSVIETTDAERRTTAPAGLQAAVDELVAKYAPSGRSFVRCVKEQ